MKNARRRRRRKNPSRTRSQRGKRAVQALAAGAVIAAGTQAYAEPIRIDNPPHGEPGHFHWPMEGANWLDIALDASQQPGDPFGPMTVRQQVYGSYGFGAIDGQQSGVQLEITAYYLLNALNEGDTIPSGASWYNGGYTFSPYYGSSLPEGEAKYVALRFDLGSGNQYGWIGVVREGLESEAFAWGYETVPGEPIDAGAIPEPGTLAMLALGATALLGRRRCRS